MSSTNLTITDNASPSVGPLARARRLWSDIRVFLLHDPPIATRVEFNSEAARDEYCQRIIQRLGVSVRHYSILNIHRIGVDAPPSYVFEEVLKWDGDSLSWPNHLATVERPEGSLERIEIYLLGRKQYPFGFKNSFFGLKFIPLFELNALRIQRVPISADFDNARYLLYKSSGGYPIGIFAIYVRSPIAKLGETKQTQLFFAVSFDFYGNAKRPRMHLVNRVWEWVHNRATGNILYLLKVFCEARFQRFLADIQESE